MTRKLKNTCHAGFAIRRNERIGFVVRNHLLTIRIANPQRFDYAGLQIQRDKSNSITHKLKNLQTQ